MNRVLFAGTGSGAGKTTVVCSFLNELIKRRFNVVSFKCGPDYIDTMFHRFVLGIPGYNLDSFFLEQNALLEHFRENCIGRDIAVLEGAMGYYDGAGFTTRASAYEIASITKTPVILIVNGKGMGNSVCAVVKGFLSYRENHNIRGVILNQVTEKTYIGVKQEIEGFGIIPCGYINTLKEDLIFSERHLGLDFTNEGNDLKGRITYLSDMVCKTLETDKILEIAKAAPIFPAVSRNTWDNALEGTKELLVAVAYDEAFTFIYEENIQLLKRHGIRPVFFSPVRDKALPQGCAGLLLSGGYPEKYARELSKNAQMRSVIRKAVLDGMPVIAECGGYMYLKDAMEGMDGGLYQMAGVFSGTARRTERPVRFGYVTLTAKRDNLLCLTGETLKAHEFHYWDCEENGDGFMAEPAGNKEPYSCIYTGKTMYAGYPHLYLLSNENAVVNFRKRCEEYKIGRKIK